MAQTLKYSQLTLKLLLVLLLFALVPFPTLSRNRLSMLLAVPISPSVSPKSSSDYRDSVARQSNTDAETIDPEFVPFNTDSFFVDETTSSSASTPTSSTGQNFNPTSTTTNITAMTSTPEPFISVNKIIRLNLWNLFNIGRFFSFSV